VSDVTPDPLYFGRRWDAPAFDDARRGPTPVGTDCGLCPAPIAEGDDGTWQVFLTADPMTAEVRPVHLECWLRQGLDSPAHVRGECSCAGLPEPEDDRTWREQGREVIRLLGHGDWLDDDHGSPRHPGSR